jgi:hypothetical protein
MVFIGIDIDMVWYGMVCIVIGNYMVWYAMAMEMVCISLPLYGMHCDVGALYKAKSTHLAKEQLDTQMEKEAHFHKNHFEF